MERTHILNKEVAAEKIHRMVLEIAEQLADDDAPVVLMGIRENGIVIAEKVRTLLQQYISNSIQVISIKMNKKNPSSIALSEETDLSNKNIIVVDDVSNSGRTLLYALKPLLNYFPKRIQTLILVKRMHSFFPIKPDYVGLSVATTSYNHIQVEVENNEITGAYLY